MAIILLGLIVVGFLFFFFDRKKDQVLVELTYQRAEWQANSIPPEYWELVKIKQGDLAYDSYGQPYAEVVLVERNEWNGGLRNEVNIVIRVDAIYDTRTKKYLVDGKPLLIGEDYVLKIGNTLFEGKIKNMFSSLEERYQDFEKADAIVEVVYREMEPWHAESLVDLKLVTNEGKEILAVQELEVVPAEVVVETDAGYLNQTFSPIKKDAHVTFYLRDVLCNNGVCTFNGNNNLLIGSGFWVDSGTIWTQKGSIKSVDIIYE